MNEILENANKEIIPWFTNHGFRILVIIVLAIAFNFLLKKTIAKIVKMSVTEAAQKSAEAEKKRERTLIRVSSWVILVMTTVIAGMMILQEIGIPIGPMLAGAGILGLAVGFGGQYLIRDYITGLLIIFENQYHIGDMVKLDATEGMVEDISLRMTTLRDMDGTVHHVPHGDIKRVSNLSKYFSRINLNVNVSYNADLEEVIKIVNKVGQDMATESHWKEEIIKAPQFLRVDDFTDSAVSIKIVGETIPNRQFMVTGELRKRIKEAFDDHHIQMPVIHQIVRRVGSSSKEDPEQ